MIRAMRTVPWKALTVPRLVAALPLLVLGIAHFTPDGRSKFQKILEASDIPAVQFNLIAAPAVEVTAGVLLLLGLMGRLGGLLGAATMAPAVWATMKLDAIPRAELPPELHFYPPLAAPLIVLVCSLVVMVMGSGRYSVDYRIAHPTPGS